MVQNGQRNLKMWGQRGNYGPPFHQCHHTLSVATYKETVYDRSSCFKMDKEICKCGGNYPPPLVQALPKAQKTTVSSGAWTRASSSKTYMQEVRGAIRGCNNSRLDIGLPPFIQRTEGPHAHNACKAQNKSRDSWDKFSSFTRFA